MPAFRKESMVLVVFLLLLQTGYGAGKSGSGADTAVYPKRVYTTLFVQTPPVVDGKLDDACWKLGEWQGNYTQFSPVYKAASSRRTDLKILYNDQSVFVAIRAYDDMQQVTRRLGRRDTYSGDIVGVQFDSYFDHRTAFEFDLTSAGQKIDVWVSNDGWDINWNAVWEGKVAYEDSAWTAEFEIPLSQLRYSASAQQVWGLDSWRLINRVQEEDHWNLVANDGTGIVYTFGELQGLEGLKKNRRLELAPYGLGSITTDKEIRGNPFVGGAKFRGQGGLDAKVGITNNFTLDATINPDFGQVEADPSVMNLTAFETYFEEKRPFFTEGKNIFEFSFDADQLFYSRRIGHAPSYHPAFDTVRMPEFTTIGGAFKLSGKTAKGLSVGIIESVTAKEMADIHDHGANFSQVAEPLSNYFIGRFQRDYDKGNTIIGGILTYTHRVLRDQHLDFLSRNAVTYGLDFTRYWKDRKYVVEVKTIGSHINGAEEAIDKLQTSSARYFQRPGIRDIRYDTTRTLLNGAGASFKIGKWSKGHWRYHEELILRSPGLELNDLGYMTLANLLKNNTSIGYYEKKNTNVFKTYTINLLQQNAWSARGESAYSLVSLAAQSEFMNGWSAQVSGQYKFRATDEWLLRGGPSMRVPGLFSYTWLLQTNTSKKLYFGFSGYYNKGLSKSLRSFSVTPEVTFRPRSNLMLSLQPSYQDNRDELQYISQVDRPSTAKTYLLGKVDNRNLGLAFRADLALTPEFTVQYYGSPFVSLGKYSYFKEVVKPLDAAFQNRFIVVAPQTTGSRYSFDDSGDGVADFSLDNPDFNYHQFRSNLVFRWEYKTGSTLFFVWSQGRTGVEQPGTFAFDEGFRDLFALHPQNVFMLKFNYLLRLK